jgi:hypothetical protein
MSARIGLFVTSEPRTKRSGVSGKVKNARTRRNPKRPINTDSFIRLDPYFLF